MYGTTLGGSLSTFVGVPSLSEMQSAVGGYIETVTRTMSPYRKGIELDVYADEEGMLKDGTPVWFVRSDTLSSVAGEIVITASDDQGETVAATEEEIRFAFDSLLSYRSPVGVVCY